MEILSTVRPEFCFSCISARRSPEPSLSLNYSIILFRASSVRGQWKAIRFVVVWAREWDAQKLEIFRVACWNDKSCAVLLDA